jgi:predicted ATPase
VNRTDPTACVARREEALDPGLLGSTFAAATSWHVLTGAACCGKTTLADMLAARGFAVLPESARWYLDRALPDSVTFYRLVGVDPDEILPACFRHHYAAVFILDRLPPVR